MDYDGYATTYSIGPVHLAQRMCETAFLNTRKSKVCERKATCRPKSVQLAIDPLYGENGGQRFGAPSNTAATDVVGQNNRPVQHEPDTRRDRSYQMTHIGTKGVSNLPKIEIGDVTVECTSGANLRKVLMRARIPLYSGLATAIHCRGLGTCGTCAVRIVGPVSPMTRIERWRLSFPPHSLESGLRLACQCRIQGDLQITKLDGLWGNKAQSEVSEAPNNALESNNSSTSEGSSR